MNDKMIFGQYYHKNSVIHKLDPRTKFIALIIFMVITFIIPFNNFILLGLLALIILSIILLTKVSLFKYLKSLKQIAFLLVFSFAFQIFTKKDGDILLTLPLAFTYVNICMVTIIWLLFIIFRKYIPFKFFITIGLVIFSFYLFTLPMNNNPFATPTIYIYEGGLVSGTFIISRVLLIIMVSTTLTLTTKPMDLANAIEWFLKPLEFIKIKTSILAMMLSIALRFIPTLFNETDKILKAQASRGVDFKEGKLHEQIKQIISLLVPMFVISFKRAIDLADAMEARGYIPGEKRTKLNVLTFKASDYLSLILLTLIMGSLIAYKVIL